MWSNVNCFSTGNSAASKISECFLHARSRLTAPVGAVAMVAVVAVEIRSEEVISLKQFQ